MNLLPGERNKGALSVAEGCEHSLNEEENFYSQLRYDTRRPSVIVRPREAESSRGYVRVFPDQSLQKHLSAIAAARSIPVPRFKYVPVNRETTARDTLVLVLRKLGLEVSFCTSPDEMGRQTRPDLLIKAFSSRRLKHRSLQICWGNEK